MKTLAVVAVALLGLSAGWMAAFAQDVAPPPGAGAPVWSSDQLDQMLGPIALYPDPLIGVMLPAASQPPEIVMADRYVSEGGDPNQVSQQPWDPSVQALVHYPAVLKWMDDNLTWTTELGQAFQSQQTAVMDSIQRLRLRAQSLGNLPDTPQENVISDSGDIDIEPVNPDDMYVPDYQPDQIYYQPGIYCTFGLALPIGGWLGYDWDWHHHHLITWGQGHDRPRGWWQRPPAERIVGAGGHNMNLWRPQTRSAPVMVLGGDRGFAERGIGRSVPQPAPHEAGRSIPHPSQAPNVTVIGRNSGGSHSSPPSGVTVIGRTPEYSRAVESRGSSESAFGGSQSAREVRESSSRGEESRGTVSIGASRGGGGGGGESRGSGGGGGGRR